MEENKFFKLKIKYLKQDTEGNIKKASEEFVLPAVSWTEAEARLIIYLRDELPEYNTVKCEPFNITDCIKDDSKELFFKTKVVYQDINEDNGKSIRIVDNYLVQADNTKEVNDKMKARLEGSVMDYEIENISKTKISQVFYEVQK